MEVLQAIIEKRTVSLTDSPNRSLLQPLSQLGPHCFEKVSEIWTLSGLPACYRGSVWWPRDRSAKFLVDDEVLLAPSDQELQLTWLVFDCEAAVTKVQI